jgi:glyoxylase-like metal-dependent hydrolase (beta-lactamase superfamily II)
MVHAEHVEHTSWHRLGPGVFVARVAELTLNVAAVAGTEGFVLVDTGSYDRETRSLLAGLAPVLEEHSLPFRALAVVNTHGHFDHCYGNAEVLRQFPDARIWGHRALPGYLRAWGEEGRADAVRFGMPRADMEAVRIVAPTGLVAPGETARIEVGGVTAVLHAPGRGHTDSDLVVHVPDADVLIAGDLLEESAPPSYGPDSFPAEWPRTLERVLEIPARVILPGHGAPVDRAFALRQLEYVWARRAGSAAE